MTPEPGRFLANLGSAAVPNAGSPLLSVDDDGVFRAVITVYGEPDIYGRIIEPGAFDASLERGYPVVSWSHDWDWTPIGATESIEIDGNRVIATGRLLIGTPDDPGDEVAIRVYRAMRETGGDGLPLIRDVSVGSLPTAPPEIEETPDGVYFRFRELDLVEWGPCLRGAHPLAKIVPADTPGSDQVEAAVSPADSDGDTATPPADDAGATDGDGAPTGGAPADEGPALSAADRRRLADLLLDLGLSA